MMSSKTHFLLTQRYHRRKPIQHKRPTINKLFSYWPAVSVYPTLFLQIILFIELFSLHYRRWYTITDPYMDTTTYLTKALAWITSSFNFSKDLSFSKLSRSSLTDSQEELIPDELKDPRLTVLSGRNAGLSSYRIRSIFSSYIWRCFTSASENVQWG